VQNPVILDYNDIDLTIRILNNHHKNKSSKTISTFNMNFQAFTDLHITLGQKTNKQASISLALAAFDVIEKGGDKVEFRAEPELRGKKAVFLKNLKEDSAGNFTAEKVTNEKDIVDLLTKDGKKPLFYIHGWKGTLNRVINNCKEAQPKFDRKETNYQLIPVLWPATGKYETGRNDAENFGFALNEAFASIISNVKMEVVTHSMGNLVLKKLAKARHDTNKEFKFDNIFMSAADVRSDIFNRDEGKNIIKMLSADTSAIVYAFQNKSDLVLASSTVLDPDKVRVPRVIGRGTKEINVPRLGLNEKSHDNDKVEYVDVAGEIPNRLNLIAQHYYALNDFAIDFYKSAKNR